MPTPEGFINTSDGQPGAPPKITIRGNNSVTQDNSPLYVIDGFPIEGPNLGSINPQDIESIEVLKDASATAIYGARGANGVIMITTKKGKVGPPSINFSTSTGYQEITKKMDLMSPFDYLSYQREKDSVSNNFYISSGVTSPGYYTDSLFYRFFPKEKYKSVDAANMQDLMYVKAPLQNYNLTISGGDGKTNYLISGNILNQDGILVNSGYKRYQGRVNLDQVISRKIKVGINANYTYNKQWGGATQPGNISGYFASTFAPTSGYGGELDAIAAVVIGGAALSGGVGRISGTVLGALILTTTTSGLIIIGVAPDWKQVVVAILIAAAVLLQGIYGDEKEAQKLYEQSRGELKFNVRIE